MNWNRAKNLTIIFLIALNIMLGILAYMERRTYTVSLSQEKNIITVLAQNKITLGTGIIKRYSPMKHILLARYEYDEEAMKAIFLPDPDNAERTESGNKTIFSNGDEKLTIQHAYVTYENKRGTGKITLTEENALALCWEFILRMPGFEDFTHDTTELYDDGILLTFRQIYKNYIIYTNYIEFIVTEYGIELIECVFSEPQGFSSNAREIASADEALFSFMQQMKYLFGDKEITVSNMDLVYYQEERSSQEDAVLKAVPYYRIFIEGLDVPFLIDAY